MIQLTLFKVKRSQIHFSDVTLQNPFTHISLANGSSMKTISTYSVSISLKLSCLLGVRCPVLK